MVDTFQEKEMHRHENVKGDGGCWHGGQVPAGGLWGHRRDEDIKTDLIRDGKMSGIIGTCQPFIKFFFVLKAT